MGGFTSGLGGDSLTGHNGNKFTTKDQDNDTQSGGNCAVDRSGAWWYHSCDTSSLNGLNSLTATDKGIVYDAFKGSSYSLKSVKMSIKPF